MSAVLLNQSLRLYTTLKAGGEADRMVIARSRDELAARAAEAHQTAEPLTVLGSGSNVLPSDRGVRGTVIINRATSIRALSDTEIEVDCGAALQDLFLKSAQLSLAGLSFAVGIPGSVGGALVSNAGAYRSSISTHLTEIECLYEGKRAWRTPEFMRFSYRDSILRDPTPPPLVLLAARFRLERGNPHAIYRDARLYQQQRISKQPPPASAGSFFKNVVDADLARQIPGLTDGMRQAGVVPAGFLIEQCNLKGTRFGGAEIGGRHANFILNVANAKASEIRRLAEFAMHQVRAKFGVKLEEEVLYLGDWSGWSIEDSAQIG